MRPGPVPVKERIYTRKLSLTADRLDTGASWRVLALPKVSDSVKNGNALKEERKQTTQGRERWEDGTPPPHRDFQCR